MIAIQTITLHRIGEKMSAAVFYNVCDECGSPTSLNNRCEVDISESEALKTLQDYIIASIENGG